MRGPTLLIVRRLHLYLSVFFAPLLLLFVVTGWAQTMGFDRSSPLLSRLSQVHEHQTFNLQQQKGGGQRFREGGPQFGGGAPGAEGAGPRFEGGAQRFGEAGRGGGRAINLPMKWLVVAMSIALIISIGLGLVLAFTMVRNRLPVVLALILGILTPVALLALAQPKASPPPAAPQPAMSPANGR
jgi:hypothetical protein